MKIVLEELRHQNEALKRINESFPVIDNLKDDSLNFANPLIEHAYEEDHFIDIKMETGTGKTYVYTRLMYELHKRGLFKFVIVVPSPSIKEGTKSFIESDYAKQHFSQFYENTNIQLNVINNGDFKAKGGRRNFPAQLAEFIESSRANSNQIEVLLINAGMLNSISMKRDNYDQTLAGGETSPIKAIAATRPVVIIDEPHRFAEGNTGYKNIKKLKPQSIVRFGATFPQKKVGRGKNAVEKPQYYQGKPQYNLNAVKSFNRGLVKGIDVIYPSLAKEVIKTTYKVKSVGKNELILEDTNKKERVVQTGENLAVADNEFEGNITYEGGSAKKGGRLSNDLVLMPGMKLIPGTFTESYQERIIKQAIDEHFRIEEQNFLRKNSDPKIKTLSLFFIDSIDSYGRRKANGAGRDKGWLIKIFEKLLRIKLTALIGKYSHPVNSREQEYCEFLRATLQSLSSEHQQVYAGYFSGDNGFKNQDDDIQAEVDDILKNKEKMLSFKDKNGNWITRRFLFSKWTLREGWDNPNVFVIAKLRTSGSENSKIQEVGRGLRLPVDENGNRVHQDEFESRLSFLIGYDEKDFADSLVNEINSDVDIQLNEEKLDERTIKLIVEDCQKSNPEFDENQLRNDLGEHHVIDFAGNFNDKVEINGKIMSGFEALEELYPIVKQKKVAVDKVRDMQKHPQPTEVELNKENWNKLRGIWLKLVRRSMIVFDHGQEDQVESIARAAFTDGNNYVKQPIQNIRRKVHVEGEAVVNNEKENAEVSQYEIMNYGKFLKQISDETSLQPAVINKYVIEGMKAKNNERVYINEDTMNNLIKDFNKRFNNFFANFYHYESLDFNASTSVYDLEKDDFVDKVSAGVIGDHILTSAEPDNKYLYDRPPLRYDSTDPELEILEHSYKNQKITVYGKLPKKAIKIPRYDHGTTTPDFIFKIEEDGEDDKYLMVETKAENRREDDNQIVKIQEKYFNKLNESGIYYMMATSDQEVQEKLRRIQDGEE
ncbi:type III restriction-modification system endonuclease [Ligilactobacillus hohenheimensis]|uniref:type III restriction-modification system endonuclease n=1 Tax=Ligilactobacillus hohenheimensis TaxID=2991832 RepID=UPI0024B94D75|nr:type III restriction-modification system endonuclease [Ligilactobacillus hohenheimensis]